jgi:hypothetical protein
MFVFENSVSSSSMISVDLARVSWLLPQLSLCENLKMTKNSYHFIFKKIVLHAMS